MVNKKWKEYQVDTLFLLVGTNPLPNYVAASLLTRPDGKIVLLATNETYEIANRLRELLKKKFSALTMPEPYEIDNADAVKIFSKVEQIVSEIKQSRTIGLNYTGGTKAMAVHTYRAIESVQPNATFSYVDARTLEMNIERGGLPTKHISIQRDCVIKLDDLVWLHGYNKSVTLRKDPISLTISQAILKVYLEGHGEDWRRWSQHSPLHTLPTLQQFPTLRPVIDEFSQIGDEEKVAAQLGFSRLSSCAKWFIGEWLEDIVTSSLKQLFHEGLIDDYAADIQLQSHRERSMQIDTAAIKGYQLFAISCIATDQKSKAKEHLLEIFVRAQQIGGEEARVGLVCLYDKPEKLKAEINENWLAQDKIQVFGPEQLENLTQSFREWIQNA